MAILVCCIYAYNVVQTMLVEILEKQEYHNLLDYKIFVVPINKKIAIRNQNFHFHQYPLIDLQKKQLFREVQFQLSYNFF